MESDATWLTDRPGAKGIEAAYCCINATLRDYGRFGLLFLNRGRAARQTGRSFVVDRPGNHTTEPCGSMGPSRSLRCLRIRLSVVAHPTRSRASVFGHRRLLPI